MDRELYAIVGVLCTSEMLRYAAWLVPVGAGLAGVALGFLAGLWATRWRPGR